MATITVSEKKNIVIGNGVRLVDGAWVEDPTLVRVSFNVLKKDGWQPAKGIQFERKHAKDVAKLLSEVE